MPHLVFTRLQRFRFWTAFAVLSAAFAPTSSLAQIVASGITGMVIDEAGRPIAGANVTAVHTVTNTMFRTSTRENGRFSFRGLPAGGPFTVSATAEDATIESMVGIETFLGENVEVRLLARSRVQVMEAFTVEVSATDLDRSSSGASSVLTSAQIRLQPTISRSFADMIKTNPFVATGVGDAVVALGQNNRFNSISVDGARINDQFGLNSSGLQSFNNPFPIDALEQFSISLAPYETRRSGFTGASVNVVTKSGGNQLHGSAYYIFNNETMAGEDIVGPTAGTRPANEESWIGFTFGGPIVKDRLFFFAAYEAYEREGAPTEPGFTPDPTDLEAIDARLSAIKDAVPKVRDVDFGVHGGAAANLAEDEKRLVKLDWNVSDEHRLTVRYSDTIGVQPAFGAYNATAFSGGAPLAMAPLVGRTTALTSNFFDVKRTEKIWAGQLFSDWTPNLKTEITYANTSFLQKTLPRSTFPEVRIYGLNGIDSAGARINNGVLAFGTENSRHGNDLDVQTETYTALADYAWKDFTFTGGVDFEESRFNNLFRQSSYGVIGYQKLSDFQNDVPFGYYRSLVQEGFPIADISEFKQIGLFAQAKFEPIPRLSLMGGVRVDLIESPISPEENPVFKSIFGITNAGTPDGTTNVAPRFSFNYAVDAESMTQVRGGVGVFLGRAPWVFFSNSYGATGVGRFAESASGPAAPKLEEYLSEQFDPENPIGTTARSGSTPVINLVKPGIKLPTVVRSNIAVDHRIKSLDAIVTAELIHTEVLSGLFIDNMNLRPTTLGADGRQRFAGSAANGGSNAIVPTFGNVLRIRNVDVGSSNYVAVGINRPTQNGWGYTATYTHGQATDAQALGSSTAGSQWQFNPVFNQNEVEEGRADFEIRHRVQLSASKEFRYWRDMRTEVSLYYEGRSGSPYSWVYTSDLNTDGFRRNDLVAVPTSPTDARFDFSALSTSEIETYLGALEETGLARFSGGYAPRNAFTLPWQNRLDLRIIQQIPAVGNVTMELFADFINFGSWLSAEIFNYIETLPGSVNTREFGSANYGTDGRIRPTDLVAQPSSQVTVNNALSRWRIQVGARLKF